MQADCEHDWKPVKTFGRKPKPMLFCEKCGAVKPASGGDG